MQSPRARASSPKEVVKEKKTKVKAKVTGEKVKTNLAKENRIFKSKSGSCVLLSLPEVQQDPRTGTEKGADLGQSRP